MTCLWEATYRQIIHIFSLKKWKRGKKQFQCVQCLPTNPPDISSAGMGIWVRLSRSVFGVISPSWRGLRQGWALGNGKCQSDVARIWQIFSTTVLELDFKALFQSVENPYLNILLGKTEYGLHSSHFSSRCITKKTPLYDHVRHIFPKSKESPSVGLYSDRNKSYAAGIGIHREVSRVIGSSVWFGCSEQTCRNYRNNWRS